MTLAEKIAQLPFYAACRNAEQLYDTVDRLTFGCIYSFADGSRLGVHLKDNTINVLSEK